MYKQRKKYSLSSKPMWGTKQALVYNKTQLVLPLAIRADAIRTCHTVAHMGVKQTLQELRKLFHWPNMDSDVEAMLTDCVGCLHKRDSNLHKGEHFGKKLPPGKLHTVYVDLIGPVSVDSEFKYLLTLMDGFTKFAAVFPLRTKRAREVTEALVIMLSGVFGGAPLRIICDRGTEFIARCTRTTMKMMGHNIEFIPADLHQANLVERFHRTLTSMIKAVRTEGVTRWVTAVQLAVQHYNQATHSSTGFAPVALHLGVERQHPGMLAPRGQEAGPINYADMDQYNKEQARIAEMVRAHIQLTQQANQVRTARYYKEANLALEPNCLVWLNKRATNQVDGDMILAKKFALQWSGPYLFLRNVNENLGEIVRQKEGQVAGRPFRVHLSKLRFYRPPEEYPGQHQDIFQPGQMGKLGDGSSSGGDEDDQLLQLPEFEIEEPLDRIPVPEDHFYDLAGERQAPELSDEIDRSHLSLAPQPVSQVAKQPPKRKGRVETWIDGAKKVTAQHKRFATQRRKEEEVSMMDVRDQVLPGSDDPGPPSPPRQPYAPAGRAAPYEPHDDAWAIPGWADRYWHPPRHEEAPQVVVGRTVRSGYEFHQQPPAHLFVDERRQDRRDRARHPSGRDEIANRRRASRAAYEAQQLYQPAQHHPPGPREPADLWLPTQGEARVPGAPLAQPDQGVVYQHPYDEIMSNVDFVYPQGNDPTWDIDFQQPSEIVDLPLSPLPKRKTEIAKSVIHDAHRKAARAVSKYTNKMVSAVSRRDRSVSVKSGMERGSAKGARVSYPKKSVSRFDQHQVMEEGEASAGSWDNGTPGGWSRPPHYQPPSHKPGKMSRESSEIDIDNSPIDWDEDYPPLGQVQNLQAMNEVWSTRSLNGTYSGGSSSVSMISGSVADDVGCDEEEEPAPCLNMVHPPPAPQPKRPNHRPQPIWIDLPNGIDSAGKRLFWEPAVLRTRDHRDELTPVSASRMAQLANARLIPETSQHWLSRGLRIEKVSLHRRENNGPAVQLTVTRPHPYGNDAAYHFRILHGLRIGNVMATKLV